MKETFKDIFEKIIRASKCPLEAERAHIPFGQKWQNVFEQIEGRRP